MTTKKQILDEYGQAIQEGDRISFSFGMPPKREYATVKEAGGTLYAHIEGDSKPNIASVRYLKQCVGNIYKEGVDDE